MFEKFDDFETEIQIDELAAILGIDEIPDEELEETYGLLY